MRAVIIEDELHGLQNLQNLLSKYCEEVEIVSTADDVTSALKVLQDPDIVFDVAFLDINLGDGKIFQVLDKLTTIPFDIIFVTAFAEFAIKACEYSSIGYIIKPIDPDELKAAVSRIKPGKNAMTAQRLEVFNQKYTNPNAFGKISISAVDGIYFVNIKDIYRLEAEDNYTHIFSVGGKMTVAKTIKSYEDLLSQVNFFRVHKKHLINLNFMSMFMKADSKVVMEDGKEIEVSRRRRPAFMELLRRLNIEIQDL